MTNTDRLQELYMQSSKHSQYQILAEPLRPHLDSAKLEVVSRYEAERLAYMERHVSWSGRTVMDVGGNTGYFTLESLARGATSATYFEGNQGHSSFVKEAGSVLGWSDRLQVHPSYLEFDDDLGSIQIDVCLLLNVLHHVGDDYGDASLSIEAAKKQILRSVNRMASHCSQLIFQLGFNWKGNPDLPLFESGTKAEQIDFIRSGTQDRWTIERVGIAEGERSQAVYRDLSDENIKRRDELGEFLNRPLFIMHSK